MGLINLKTDLKNLKYGKDRKDGGDSGQPYIKSRIPDGLTSSSPDFLLRNGYLNPLSTAEDISRLTKMFFDLKSSNGLLFTAKQNLLSRTAVKTQTSTGVLNNGVYTPLSTLAQAGVSSIGFHLNKQGINPFELTGAYSNNNSLYGVKVKYTQPTTENRLNQLYNQYIAVKNESVNILSYSGGPDSNLGIGNTNIRFASPDQRTGINNYQTKSPSYSLFFTGAYSSIFEPGNYLKTLYDVKLNKGVFGKYSRLIGLSQLQYDILQPYNTEGKSVGNYNNNVYERAIEGNTWPKNSPLIYENNTFTYTQEDIISSTPNKFNPSPKSQDFRAILREKLQGTQKTTAINSGATPISPSYNVADNKTIEGRVLLGDPGNKQGKNLSSYTNGSGIGPVDKINALPIYRSQWVTPDNGLKNDLVKFRIAAIDNDNPNFKTFMHFRAFIDSFSDSYTGEWGSTRYLGRGENFYNYTGFNRTISLSWKVVAQSKEELIPMHKKLNYLASNLMPDYSNNGYMRGPLLQMTVGGYLYEQVGFLTSLTYTIPTESPWEIGINDEGNFDSTVKELSHMIEVQASFTPIHNFVPAKQSLVFDDQLQATIKDKNGVDVVVSNGFAKGYGPERFIALSTGDDKSNNNYDTAQPYNISKYKVV
jgi:hypothetical protein